MLTAVVYDTDNSGKQAEVCRLTTERGRVVPSTKHPSGLFVLNRHLFDEQGRRVDRNSGDEFLRLMPAAYSGTRTRVGLIEDVGVSAKMVDGRLQIQIDLQTKGDFVGHPFRGNQWSGGGGEMMVPDRDMGSGVAEISGDQDMAAQAAAARAKLSKYVDFDATLARVDKLAATAKEKSDEAVSLGDKPIPPIKKPVSGEGFEGISEEDIRAAFSEDKVSVYMAMSRATALKVLGGDHIKNSLETGKGTFKTVAEDRVPKEREALGVKADLKDFDGFPKYGFVSNKGHMDDDGIVGFGYGSLYLEFNDSVRERTTVTIGDSYNNNSGSRYRIPAPIDAVGGQQFHGDYADDHQTAAAGIKEFKENPNNGNIRSLARTSEYVEAQMYGRLTASDIRAIHVESKKDAAALSKVLKKQKLDIEIKPTKTHTVLKKLNEGYLDDWAKVGPEDLSRLGDSYLPHGFHTLGANVWAEGWSKAREGWNLPKTKAAVAKYHKAKDVPPDVMREIMIEYVTEARKGPAGTLPKVLHMKKSTRDGFTQDVFNEDLLKEYVVS